MHPLNKLYVLVFLLLTISHAGHAQETAIEHWDFKLDARKWTLAYRNADARETAHMYVLEGENTYFWNELVSSYHYKVTTTPDEHVMAFIQDLSERCIPLKVNPMGNGPNSVILQWEGDCRVTGPQFEIRRVDSNTSGFDHLVYSAKTTRVTQEKKEAWLAIIQAAKLK